MNLENETYLVSYYLNNFNKINCFEVEYFQNEDLISILKALKEMKSKKLDFSLDTLKIELSSINSKIKFEDISNLKQAYKEFENIEYHISSLKEDYNKNVTGKKLLELLISKVNSANQINSSDIISCLDEIKLKIVPEVNKVFYNTEEVLNRYEEILKNRADTKKTRTSGFRCIDENLTRPGALGEIRIIAALRGSGKSLFRKTILNNLMVRKVPIVDFSMEMSESSESDRLFSMRSGISMMELNKNPNEILESEKYEIVKNDLSKYNNYLFTDKSDWTFDEIDKAIYGAKEYFRKNNLFDSEEYMVASFDVLNMVLDFGDQSPQTIMIAMDRFHRLTKKHNIHSIGIVQVNENRLRGRTFSEPEDVDRYRPNLEDIYGGSAYAQRAREAVILHRPKFMKERFFPEMSEILELEEDILEYHCVKQNDGKLFMEKFIFEGDKMRILPRLKIGITE